MGYTLKKKHGMPAPNKIVYNNPYKSNKTNWDDPAKWKGKRCFILAGGPSMKDLDFTPLKNELTIGVNKTCLYYNTTINYSMDTIFHNLMYSKSKHAEPGLQGAWLNYKGTKVFLNDDRFKFCDEAVLIPRLKTQTLSFDLSQGIFGSNNSGFGALMIAIALGCNPIYLLGYDMKTSGSNTHWHTGYKRDSFEAQANRLKRFIQPYNEFAPAIKALGINVYNMSCDTALTCFEHKDMSEVMFTNEVDSKPIYVAYYTKDTGYEQEAMKLKASLDKFNLSYDIESIESLGDWDKNTHYKPFFLEKMLKKHYPKPIVYLDADAIVNSYPELFDKSHPKIGVHYLKHRDYGNTDIKEILSGTIYLPNTDKTMEIIENWQRLCISHERTWDQKLLEKLLDDYWDIPATYCNIFDFMNVDNPVITHYQASRKYRRMKL